MYTYLGIIILLVVGLYLFGYLFDNRKEKILSVQKLLRKTSRIVPNWRGINMCEYKPKTQLKLACIVLEPNGVERMVFMREKDLYPPSTDVERSPS